MLVVMRDVRGENVLEMAAAEDQEPVEAFAADRADPAFGVRAPLSAPGPGVGCQNSVRTQRNQRFAGRTPILAPHMLM